MDAYITPPWDTVRTAVWARKWLDTYGKCTASGSHLPNCKCKSGPPLGVLVALALKRET